MSDTIQPDISVFKQAISVAEKVYLLSSILPEYHRFALTSQLRRSIVLICNNLTTVVNSDSKLAIKKNTEQFISVYAEIKTQLKISLTLGYFTRNELADLETALDYVLTFCHNNLASFNAN